VVHICNDISGHERLHGDHESHANGVKNEIGDMNMNFAIYTFMIANTCFKNRDKHYEAIAK